VFITVLTVVLINIVTVNPGPTCYSMLVKINQAFAWQCFRIVACTCHLTETFVNHPQTVCH